MIFSFSFFLGKKKGYQWKFGSGGGFGLKNRRWGVAAYGATRTKLLTHLLTTRKLTDFWNLSRDKT